MAAKPGAGRWRIRLKRLWSSASVILPSFLTRDWRYADLASPHPLTAHMDGLRAIAALFVYIMHLSMGFDRTLLQGYGPGLSSSLTSLPIIRIFRSGRSMVRIFFVLSGYVLTASPAKRMHLESKDAAGQAHRAIATATLKRPLRLFIPPVATTFLVMLLLSMGLYPTAAQLETLPAHPHVQTIIHQSTFLAQLSDWFVFVFTILTNPWVWEEDSSTVPNVSYYGSHLWTIQTEFRCSMVIFAVLTGLIRLKTSLGRYFLCALLFSYCMVWARWMSDSS